MRNAVTFRVSRSLELVISNAWEATTAGSDMGGPDEKHIGFNIYRRIK
jgi:hypothetical protein